MSKNMGVYPQIIHFNRVFPYKPSIVGYPYFWKQPFEGFFATPLKIMEPEEKWMGDHGPETPKSGQIKQTHIYTKSSVAEDENDPNFPNMPSTKKIPKRTDLECVQRCQMLKICCFVRNGKELFLLRKWKMMRNNCNLKPCDT